MIGTTLGPYIVERELGRGGMGVVYVGMHQLLGQRVAIKVLLPEMSKSPEILQRFLAEARAASASRHAGIIQVFDLAVSDGATYIAMELLEGESLAARLRRFHKLELPEALGIVRQVASALVAAHEAGVVHRDLKPDNVFLVSDPEIPLGLRSKILDFGISKVAAHHRVTGGGAMTGTGVIMGTPHYMSPEQCRGDASINHQSDLYSLGCMLFELLTGHVPFDGEVAVIVGAHLYVEAPLLRKIDSEVPRDVEKLISSLLAKRREERPADAAAVVAALERMGGRKVRAPRQAMAVAAPRIRSLTGAKTFLAAAGQSHALRRRRGKWVVFAAVGTACALLLGAIGAHSQEPRSHHAIANRAQLDAGDTAATRYGVDGGPADVLGVPESPLDALSPHDSSYGADAAGVEAAAETAVEPPVQRALSKAALKSEPARKRSQARSIPVDAAQSPGNATGPSKLGAQIDLYLQSVPPGAIVFIDGVEVGTTPYRSRMTPRVAVARIRLYKRGYYSKTFSVEVDLPVSRTERLVAEPQATPTRPGDRYADPFTEKMP